MFEKLVAIEPIRLDPKWEGELKKYAKEVKLYPDIPENNKEIVHRISDADGVLLSYTSRIDREVLAQCPNIKYIGMCCSLYSPQSANVDIVGAERQGITVFGVRDYGDEGVPEYVISELVRFLHGFGGPMWRDYPTELKGIPVGVVGLGTTGALVASALKHFGAKVSYFSRTRKPELEEAHGYRFLPLHLLLEQVDILVTCLNKNTILLHQDEFQQFGDGKILMNISIGPAHDLAAAQQWLDRGNYLFGDTAGAVDPTGSLLQHQNVFCVEKSAGMTGQARYRLGQKVVENIERFFKQS